MHTSSKTSPSRKLSFSDAADIHPPGQPMKVFVRERPTPPSEPRADLDLGPTTITMRTPRVNVRGEKESEETTFTFDSVFDRTASQEAVFDAAFLPQVRNLFLGRDTLTFAYGITNAGKTFTIQGDEDGGGGRGALPRAFEAIDAALREHRLRSAGTPPPIRDAPTSLSTDPACSYQLLVSFLEVYGNDAYDLLNNRARVSLKEDRGKVFVEGLNEVEVDEAGEAAATVRAGWELRKSSSNGVNINSSRSHAVLCVKLLTVRPDAPDRATVSRMCVVDLAGAERQKKTNSSGAGLQEASSINKDLSVLGKCLRDLRFNQAKPGAKKRLPPYRDARITMLFRDYLTGYGQTTVVAAINPRAVDAVGTMDTLKFAAVAKDTQTIAAHGAVKRPWVPRRAASSVLPRGATSASAAWAPAPALAAQPSGESVAPDESSGGAEWDGAWGEDDDVAEYLDRLPEQLRTALELHVRQEVGHEYRALMREQEERLEAQLQEQLEKQEEWFREKLERHERKVETENHAVSVHSHIEFTDQVKRQKQTEAELQRRMGEKDEEIGGMYAPDGRTFAPTPCRASQRSHARRVSGASSCRSSRLNCIGYAESAPSPTPTMHARSSRPRAKRRRSSGTSCETRLALASARMRRRPTRSPGSWQWRRSSRRPSCPRSRRAAVARARRASCADRLGPRW